MGEQETKALITSAVWAVVMLIAAFFYCRKTGLSKKYLFFHLIPVAGHVVFLAAVAFNQWPKSTIGYDKELA